MLIYGSLLRAGTYKFHRACVRALHVCISRAGAAIRRVWPSAHVCMAFPCERRHSARVRSGVRACTRATAGRRYSLAGGEALEEREGVAALAAGVVAATRSERGAKEAVHDFVDKTFAQPTYCGLCKTLIWSFKKGLTCTMCGIAAHDKVRVSACVWGEGRGGSPTSARARAAAVPCARLRATLRAAARRPARALRVGGRRLRGPVRAEAGRRVARAAGATTRAWRYAIP